MTDASAEDRSAAGSTQAVASPPQRRLVRLPKDTPGAGVAAGLGAYFGVDPVLFRLAFVLLALAGGIGIILYIACWIAMPEGTPDDVAGPPPAPERTTQWVLVGLAAAAGLLVLTQVPFWAPTRPWGGGPLLWAVALIVLGVALFRYDADRRAGGGRTGRGTEPASTGSTAVAAPPATRGGPAGTAVPPAPPAQTSPPDRPQPAEPPSILARVATGLGLLAIGVAALLDNAGALHLAAYHYVALALTIAGGALLVGAWWGRARGFIAVGLLLLPVLVVTSAFGAVWGRGAEIGDRHHRPETVAEAAAPYRLFAGELSIDLTDLEAADVRVDAAVGAGDLLVIVPDDVTVVVEGRTGAGELELLDHIVGGINVRRASTFNADPDAPTYHIEARTGVGRVRVVQAASADQETRTLP